LDLWGWRRLKLWRWRRRDRRRKGHEGPLDLLDHRVELGAEASGVNYGKPPDFAALAAHLDIERCLRVAPAVGAFQDEAAGKWAVPRDASVLDAPKSGQQAFHGAIDKPQSVDAEPAVAGLPVAPMVFVDA